MAIDCVNIPRGWARAELVFEAPSGGYSISDKIRYIWMGDTLVELICPTFPDGVTGNSPETFAENLAIAIGNGNGSGIDSVGQCDNATLEDLRQERQLHARHVGDNVVEILMRYSDGVCTECENVSGRDLGTGCISLFIANPYGLMFRFPFESAGTNFDCCSDEDCTLDSGRGKVEFDFEYSQIGKLNTLLFEAVDVDTCDLFEFSPINIDYGVTSNEPDESSKVLLGSESASEGLLFAESFANLIASNEFLSVYAEYDFDVKQVGHLVIIEFDILDQCLCENAWELTTTDTLTIDPAFGPFQPYCDCNGEVEEPCSPDKSVLLCDNFPPDTLTITFQFNELDNATYGTGSPDVRYWLDTVASPVGPPSELSTAYFDYTSFDEFVDGWCNWYNTNIPDICPGGIVEFIHRGCGFVEATMSPECWQEIAGNPGGDTCLLLDNFNIFAWSGDTGNQRGEFSIQFLTNPATFPACGNYLHFDNTNVEHIKIDNDPFYYINAGTAFTMEWWFKLDSLSGGPSVLIARSRRNDANENNYAYPRFEVLIDLSKRVVIKVSPAQPTSCHTSFYTGVNAVQLGKWHHLVIQRVANGFQPADFQIWVDSVDQGPLANINSLVAAHADFEQLFDCVGVPDVGYIQDGNWSMGVLFQGQDQPDKRNFPIVPPVQEVNSFHGGFAAFRYYHRYLAGAEILNNYTNGLAGCPSYRLDPTVLRMELNFNQLSGAVVPNIAAGAPNNGELVPFGNYLISNNQISSITPNTNVQYGYTDARQNSDAWRSLDEGVALGSIEICDDGLCNFGSSSCIKLEFQSCDPYAPVVNSSDIPTFMQQLDQALQNLSGCTPYEIESRNVTYEISGDTITVQYDTTNEDCCSRQAVVRTQFNLPGLTYNSFAAACFVENPVTVDKEDKLCCEYEDPPPPIFDPPEIPDTSLETPSISAECRQFVPLECCVYGMAGIRKAWIIDYVFYDCIFYDQSKTITEIVLKENGYWTEVCVNEFISNFQIVQNQGKEGISYTHTANMVVPVMQQANRNEFMKRQWRRIAVIIQDRNGKNWFLGEWFAARIRQIAAQTGVKSGENFYSYNIIQTDYEHAREIEQAVIDSLKTSLADCGDYVGMSEFGNNALSELAECELSLYTGTDLN